MRILILTPRLPWPPRDGGRIAMARLAQSLAACDAAVEILSLNPRKHQSAVEGPVPIHAVDVDTSRFVGPALRSIGREEPFLVTRFLSREFSELLETRLKKFAPHVVQIESPFLLPYASQARNARRVLRSHNVEFTIWAGLARLERNPLRRFAMQRIAISLGAYEIRAMNKLEAVIPISQDDADAFRVLGCTRPMHVAPCGVPLPELGDDADPLRVGFIGSLDYRPNQDAVRWILDELWPRVTQRMPEARLEIAGSSPPPWLRDRAREVPDAQQFLRGVSVFIAPLFAGGGMRIKVLEAMALGKPIVATTLGAGGIEVEHERDILLADDADAFADAVVRLLRDRATAARLGIAARETVAKNYDSDAIARGLIAFYESL